jgi:type I restriction enzyme M protein
VIYKHTETGEDVVVERTEEVTEIDPKTGNEAIRTVRVRDRIVDDELPEAAIAFRSWLGEQEQ